MTRAARKGLLSSSAAAPGFVIPMQFSMSPLPFTTGLPAPWVPRALPDRLATDMAGVVLRPPVVAATEPDDEEEELGDEEDLSVAQPAADEDSAFDDFDDDFDDDFEEEEDDPDWDHPDDGEGDTPPAGKGPGRKK